MVHDGDLPIKEGLIELLRLGQHFFKRDRCNSLTSFGRTSNCLYDCREICIESTTSKETHHGGRYKTKYAKGVWVMKIDSYHETHHDTRYKTKCARDAWVENTRSTLKEIHYSERHKAKYIESTWIEKTQPTSKETYHDKRHKTKYAQDT